MAALLTVEDKAQLFRHEDYLASADDRKLGRH